MKLINKKICISALVILFWLLVWHILSLIVGVKYILPSPIATLQALGQLFLESDFYHSIALSILRVFVGFLVGVVLAAFLAIAAERIKIIEALFSPIIRIIKSTPVASIIIILWVILGGKNVPIAISALMVIPIIWQNVRDGFAAIDPRMEEVGLVYGFGYFKRLQLIVIPTIAKFLFTGVITSSGLAWKAGIAAEIICMTKSSIGKHIYDAKYVLDAPSMYAWTAVVVVLSLIIEKLIIKFIGAVGKNVYRS